MAGLGVGAFINYKMEMHIPRAFFAPRSARTVESRGRIPNMSNASATPSTTTAALSKDEAFAQQKARTQALRSIDLGTILSDRYGAAKDGRETIATIKKSNERCRQQKWKIAQGHHINVLENGSFFDLSFRQGGAGAIDLVMHLERCDFEHASKMLQMWYPNQQSLAGTMAPKANRPPGEPAPSKPKVLPAHRISSPRFWLPNEDRAQWERTRVDYNARVRRYLEHDRGFPREIVDLAMTNNWAYPVEKTLVDLVKTPASEKFADELENLAVKNNCQFTQSDTDQNDNPRTTLHGGLRKPAIRLRMESRPEFDRLLKSPPPYRLPGSTDEFRAEIARIDRQPELAFPILKFLTHTPIATSLRALHGSHKQAVGPKTEGAFVVHPLTEKTTRLVLTESPNEALSYLALKRPAEDTTIYGLSGSGNINELIPFLKQQNVTVVNAFNNEGAGRKFAKRIHEQLGGAGVAVEDDLPPGGEVKIEADNDAENKKYFDRIREAAIQHQVRFVEKVIPAKPGDSPERFRMRIESSASIWELLDVNDPAARRRYLEEQRAGKITEGYWHFRETAEIEPVCKDYNDVLKGSERRVFTTEFAREFDRTHAYMNPKAPTSLHTEKFAPVAAATIAPSSGADNSPPSTAAPDSPGLD